MGEQGTRPSEAFSWNTGGNNRATPTGAKKTLGLILREGVASALVNWAWHLVGQWITYLDTGRPRTFDNLGDALQELDVDETAIVCERYDFWAPLQQQWGTVFGASGVTGRALCTDGRWLWGAFTDTDLKIVTMDKATGAILSTLTLSGISSPRALCTDGQRVYLGWGNGNTDGGVKAFNIGTDGALTTAAGWTEYDHTGAVYGLATDGRRVFWCGRTDDPGTGSCALGALFCDDGAVDWDDLPAGFGATDAFWDVVTDGELVCFGGEEDSGSKTLYQYAVDGSGLAKSSVNAGSNILAIAMSPEWLVAVTDDSNVYLVSRSRYGTAAEVVDTVSSVFAAMASGGASAVIVDGVAFISGLPSSSSDPTIRSYRIADSGLTSVFDAGLEKLRTFAHGADSGAGALQVHGLCSDGFALYSTGEEDDAASPGDSCWRHYLPTDGPATVLRVDGTMGQRVSVGLSGHDQPVFYGAPKLRLSGV